MAGRTRTDVEEEGQPGIVVIHRKDAAVHAGVFISVIAAQVHGTTGGAGWRQLIARATADTETTDETFMALRRLARQRGETLTILEEEVPAHV